MAAATMVTVTVPDGVFEGQEFLLEYEGQQLAVCCPDGCGPGSDITLEVPVATGAGGSGAAPPNLVDVAVPDGCFEGMEFTVTFEGREFNITVPDGVSPGEMITVEVPPGPEDDGRSPGLPKSPALRKSPLPAEEQPPPKPKAPMDLKEIPAFRGAPSGAPSGQQKKPSASKYLAGLDIPAYRGPLKGVTHNSVNAHAKWEPASNLFDMGPDQGYGRPAGEFHIGQLVQVERSNGTWTYAKMMDYDPSGDTYTVMTKAGPKYFVERDYITAETIENPHGGCAQQ